MNITSISTVQRPENKESRVKIWLQLSRAPFHSVGVLPFILGAVLAWKTSGQFHWPIFLLSIAAVICIMLATYYNGEFYDLEGDTLTTSTAFSGGSQVLVKKQLPAHVPRWAANISIVLAMAIGLTLVFIFHTGFWTLPLGIIGIISGFYYSAPPFRWVRTGFGEIMIGFNYGWLPIAVSFYLQTGYFHPLIHWLALPVGLTIFNVIFLNEFPDYQADKAVRKNNLLVRIGLPNGRILYLTILLLSSATFFLSVHAGAPNQSLYLYAAVIALSLILISALMLNKHMEFKTLEILCGLNIMVNLLTTGAYIMGLLLH